MTQAAIERFATPLTLEGRAEQRQLRCRVLQSPLAGVSDRIFRKLVRRWAPDALLFTEMVNATSLELGHCLLYTSPSPRDRQKSRMPSSA